MIQKSASQDDVLRAYFLKGEALIISNQNQIAFLILASEKEHLLFTADPQRNLYLCIKIFSNP